MSSLAATGSVPDWTGVNYAQDQENVDGRMSGQKTLRQLYRFESPHHALPYWCLLIQQFSTIVGVLRDGVDRFRDQFSMRDPITPQLIDYDLS